ncbi:MAG: carboxypeptidase M32 [Coxiellaceae bacterium]|nr:carboxypeptidase M32 [Coxiellaceae bacterium]
MSYEQLSQHFEKLSHLKQLDHLAGWDEQVMMPAGGGDSRAAAMATLNGVQHDMLTQPQVGEWLSAAREETLTSPWQTSNLEWMNKQYRNATCVPKDLVEANTRAMMKTQQAWRVMRADNNWKDFAPLLDESFTLTYDIAKIRGEALSLSPYDVMLDDFCAGESQASIDPVFDKLQAALPDMIQQVMQHQQSRHTQQPHGPFNTEKQRELGLEAMRILTFDFNHGRLDISHHPFCTGGPTDTRITTRYNSDEFISSMMAICHETGHAKYEQQLPLEWNNQPVGQIHSMAMHESQSLLIEMQACRTLEFMTYLEPIIKQHFGDQEAFNAKNLFELYTHVEPGYIRVDADEACYPLHVILRYEIEKQLFSGQAKISDLPELWNDYMTRFFSLSTLGNDTNGVMQDVHWPSGAYGYFPAYTIGRLIAAQLFQQALKDDDSIMPSISQGNFFPLFRWLKQHVHQHASSLTSDQILQQATKESLNPDYFLQHIQQRYL